MTIFRPLGHFDSKVESWWPNLSCSQLFGLCNFVKLYCSETNSTLLIRSRVKDFFYFNQLSYKSTGTKQKCGATGSQLSRSSNLYGLESTHCIINDTSSTAWQRNRITVDKPNDWLPNSNEDLGHINNYNVFKVYGLVFLNVWFKSRAFVKWDFSTVDYRMASSFTPKMKP